ncbi:unnamed protein product [Trichogramma brassicae]|uniref:Uncharacterized protein n=1 Tax=Trichogramma brassicae TaxID=86971 RepID=A0A6H5IV83_9HYME|nr:unnamed protein product [Trichogramma brassicae]
MNRQTNTANSLEAHLELSALRISHQAPKNKEQSTTVASRNSPRFTPRSATTRSTTEASSQQYATTIKNSRQRASSFNRKTTQLSRTNKPPSTTGAPQLDKDSSKANNNNNEAAVASTSRPTPRKALYHQPSRLVSRNRLIPKLRLPRD